MKFVVPQPELLQALARVRSAIDQKSVIPILDTVLIEQDETGVRLVGTDMNLRATARLDFPGEGQVVVDAKRIGEFVKRLDTDAQVTVEAKNDRLSVRAGKARANILTFSDDEFPTAPKAGSLASFVLSAKQARHLLLEPTVSVSDNDLRYYLCGVHLCSRDDKLIGEATDGFNMTRMVQPLPDGVDEVPSIIVPTKAIDVLSKFLDEGDVEIIISEMQIAFVTSSGEVVSRLVQGKFPDCDRIIPEKSKHTATFDRALALKVMERVACISDDMKSLSISPTDSGLCVSVAGRAVDEGDDIIEADITGEPERTAFTFKKIQTALSSFEGDQAVMFFSGHGSPHRFQDVARPDDVHVTMPARG